MASSISPKSSSTRSYLGIELSSTFANNKASHGSLSLDYRRVKHWAKSGTCSKLLRSYNDRLSNSNNMFLMKCSLFPWFISLLDMSLRFVRTKCYRIVA